MKHPALHCRHSFPLIFLIVLALTLCFPSATKSSPSVESAPHRVSIINSCTESAAPNLLAQTANDVFFLANQTGVGLSLWRSDGTADGTRVITAISPDADLQPISPGVWLSDRFFFLTRTPIVHTSPTDPSPYWTFALWASDGTPDGTRQVSQIQTSIQSPNFTGPVAMNGALYFIFSEMGWSGQNGAFELWRSDGTDAGTRIMFQGATEPYYVHLELVVYDNALFFPAWDAEHGQELWRSDGTAQGTGLFADLNPSGSSRPGNLYASGSSLYFVAHHVSGDWVVWKSDGTPAGSLPVLSDAYQDPQGQMVELGTILYFFARTPSAGLRLFRTDGSATGTWMVNDVSTQPLDKFAPKLMHVGNTLYFIANGRELWRSDGTNAGTAMVKTIFTEHQEAELWQVLDLGGDHFYFTTIGVGAPAMLWRSDGTEAGTQQVIVGSDGLNQPLNVASGPMLIQGSRVIVSGVYPCVGTELLRLDEPPSTDPPRAELVKDIATRTLGSGFAGAMAYQGKVYFQASDGLTGVQLYVSDGTEGGTHLVKALTGVKPGLGGVSDGFEAAGAGDWLYFIARDTLGLQLWRTDGTEANTIRLTDREAAYPLNGPRGLGAFRDRMYFFNNFSGNEALWSSDGSPTGTAPVFTFEPQYVAVGSPLAFNGALYMLLANPAGGGQLYRSDGTAAGTTLVTAWPSGQGTTLTGLVRAGSRLFFTAWDAAHGQELWQTDGTPQGTQLSADLTPGPSSTSFRAIQPIGDGVILVTKGAQAWTMWRAGGTASGVTPLLYVANPQVGDPISAIKGSGSLVFFTANVPEIQCCGALMAPWPGPLRSPPRWANLFPPAAGCISLPGTRYAVGSCGPATARLRRLTWWQTYGMDLLRRTPRRSSTQPVSCGSLRKTQNTALNRG